MLLILRASDVPLDLAEFFEPANAAVGLPDVWRIPTQPFSAKSLGFEDVDHFAVMPEALVEPCIKAGTSVKGCCPNCGAPWERVMENTGHINKREPAHCPHSNKTKTDSTGWGPTKRVTQRFRPTCDCGEHEPVPSVVLDPFLGTGTVGAVAIKFGRHYIGIDLNPQYCEIAEARFAKTRREFQPALLEV